MGPCALGEGPCGSDVPEKAIPVPALLMTGFPGFLGSALLPRLLARREGADAVCVVQRHHLPTAVARVATLEARHPHVRGRIRLVFTRHGLGQRPLHQRRERVVTAEAEIQVIDGPLVSPLGLFGWNGE